MCITRGTAATKSSGLLLPQKHILSPNHMNDNSSQSQNGANSGSGVALPVGLELGHYRLLRKIGQGGFGITYLAEHMQSHEQVVIKENLPTFYAYRDNDTLRIHPLDDDSSAENYSHTLQRFVDEARTLARLNHPNIVRVHEAFEALGSAYYVMPLIPGKELHKAAPSVVDEAWLRPILKAVLSALSYLHGENLLHRDIKPANILLQEDGTPILIDFGTARALQSERSATMIGTPGYTPIEQITTHGKRGPWTDIYALGATCYRLITGERPPEANERLSDDEDPYRPLIKRSELRERFSRILLQSIDTALAIRAKNRWQTAQAWLEELDKLEPQSAATKTIDSTPLTAVAIEPDSASAPSAPTDKATASATARPETKNKRKAFTIGALVLALAGAIFISTTASDATSDNDKSAPKNSVVVPPKEEAQNKLKTMGITDYDAAIKKQWSNPETLRLLIAVGADVNQFPLLYEAIDNGYIECVQLLLAAPNIDVNKANGNDTTPLMRAVEKGNTECVNLLLLAPDINVNKADTWRETPLHTAASNGYAECMKLLLAAPNIDVNRIGGRDDHTPLYYAVKEGHTECVRLLLSAPGIEVNKPTEENIAPLYEAARLGRTKCLKLLLEAPGIDVNKADRDGATPLYMAVDNKHTECVRRLLTAPGVNVNKANKGETPLISAAANGYTEGVRLLLSAPGIDVNKSTHDGATSLFFAARNGHTECVKLLLAAPGIDANKASDKGYAPLYLAARNGHTECVKLLLNVPGIDINRSEENDITALGAAAEQGQEGCVKLLLNAPGINPNCVNNDGETPLITAARKGYTGCVKSLINTPGIDINLTDKNGKTALDLATANDHSECAELIRAASGQ